jgi:hypothetical protein
MGITSGRVRVSNKGDRTAVTPVRAVIASLLHPEINQGLAPPQRPSARIFYSSRLQASLRLHAASARRRSTGATQFLAGEDHARA